MAVNIDNNQPIYIISDHTLDKETFRAATERAYNYYSWLQVYSKAYVDTDGKEKVNIVRVKVSGIDHNGDYVLTLDEFATARDIDEARKGWAELIRDFGWKVVDDNNFLSLSELSDPSRPFHSMLYHNI